MQYLSLADVADAAIAVWTSAAAHYKTSWAVWVAYTDVLMWVPIGSYALSPLTSIYCFVAERINMTLHGPSSKMSVLKISIIPKRSGMPGSALSMRMALWLHLRKPSRALNVHDPRLKRDG